MSRRSLAAVLAVWVAGPWAGCEREPVAPPASPPSERAGGAGAVPAVDGLLMWPSSRSRG